jgi:hypothetical protein
VKVALETKLLAYTEGIIRAKQRDATLALIHRPPREAAVASARFLRELFNVLVRNAAGKFAVLPEAETARFIRPPRRR